MSEVLVKIQPPDHPVHMPPAATFSPEVEAEIDRHIAKYPVKRSAILPLMRSLKARKPRSMLALALRCKSSSESCTQ